MDPLHIIHKYYGHTPLLEQLFLAHAQSVAQRALSVASTHPDLGLDTTFLYQAGMLHDIGIFLTNAPRIYCYGAEPYLRHGYLGAMLLRREGLPLHARVCERHTGTGLPASEIAAAHLPLPVGQDFVPESPEEIVICYADKFYSKTHLTHEKSAEEVCRSLARFGPAAVARFESWHESYQ